MRKKYREVSNFVVIEGGRLECMCAGAYVADDDNMLRHKSTKHLAFTLGSSKIVFECPSAFDLLNMNPGLIREIKRPFIVLDRNGIYHFATGFDPTNSTIICESYQLPAYLTTEMWYPYYSNSWTPVFHWGGGLQ